jgi:hypothetical protein
MADAMHANKAKFTGPGRYPNEIIAVYLGKTALDDSYGGLGTIVLSADGRSGTFELNDHKAAGHFDCGAAPSRRERSDCRVTVRYMCDERAARVLQQSTREARKCVEPEHWLHFSTIKRSHSELSWKASTKAKWMRSTTRV